MEIQRLGLALRLTEICRGFEFYECILVQIRRQDETQQDVGRRLASAVLSRLIPSWAWRQKQKDLPSNRREKNCSLPFDSSLHSTTSRQERTPEQNNEHTFITAKERHLADCTKLYSLVTEPHVYEQPVKSRYMEVERPALRNGVSGLNVSPADFVTK